MRSQTDCFFQVYSAKSNKFGQSVNEKIICLLELQIFFFLSINTNENTQISHDLQRRNFLLSFFKKRNILNGKLNCLKRQLDRASTIDPQMYVRPYPVLVRTDTSLAYFLSCFSSSSSSSSLPFRCQRLLPHRQTGVNFNKLLHTYQRTNERTTILCKANHSFSEGN